MGCALTNKDENQQREVNLCKQAIRRKGNTVLEFVTDPAATPEDVYRNDIFGCVAKSDFLICFTDGSSTGMGIEIGAALYRYQKPILAVCRWENQNKVSRLVCGISAEFPRQSFDFQPYRHLNWVWDFFLPDFLERIKDPTSQQFDLCLNQPV